MLGDAAQIRGVDTAVAMEEAIENNAVENMELENDLSNNPTNKPTPATEPHTIDYDTVDDGPMFQPDHEPLATTIPDIAISTKPNTPDKSPMPTKTERPSRIRKQVQSYVPSMKAKRTNILKWQRWKPYLKL